MELTPEEETSLTYGLNNVETIPYDEIDKKAIIKNLYDTLYKTYCDKNADYGDSFAKVRQKYNDRFPVILIRLQDKFQRLEQLLLNGNSKVKDESITDTLLDIANYCVMEICELTCDKET
jgi:malate synthase